MSLKTSQLQVKGNKKY